MSKNQPAPFRGMAAGQAGGILASFAMNAFQKGWSRFVTMPMGEDPATVKAAQSASRAATGAYFAKENKKDAGNGVHYLFGASVGATYGLLAEYRPVVTRGFGSGLALVSTTAFDEAGVPALGLSEPPTSFGAKTHLYAYASHFVFGGVTEGVRRLLRSSGSSTRSA